MRFTSVFFAGLVAVASAQDATPEEGTPSVTPVADAPTPTMSLTPEQSRVAACLEACADGDVSCEAKCVNVPNPNEDMVSANQACVEACPRGNGTEADILAYETCLVGCVGTHYHPSTTGGSTSPTGDSNGNGDGDNSSSDGNGGSDSNGNGDSTSEGAEGSDSNDDDDDDDNGNSGAAALSLSTTAFGLAAFIAAFAAL